MTSIEDVFDKLKKLTQCAWAAAPDKTSGLLSLEELIIGDKNFTPDVELLLDELKTISSVDKVNNILRVLSYVHVTARMRDISSSPFFKFLNENSEYIDTFLSGLKVMYGMAVRDKKITSVYRGVDPNTWPLVTSMKKGGIFVQMSFESYTLEKYIALGRQFAKPYTGPDPALYDKQFIFVIDNFDKIPHVAITETPLAHEEERLVVPCIYKINDVVMAMYDVCEIHLEYLIGTYCLNANTIDPTKNLYKMKNGNGIIRYYSNELIANAKVTASGTFDTTYTVDTVVPAVDSTVTLRVLPTFNLQIPYDNSSTSRDLIDLIQKHGQVFNPFMHKEVEITGGEMVKEEIQRHYQNKVNINSQPMSKMERLILHPDMQKQLNNVLTWSFNTTQSVGRLLFGARKVTNIDDDLFVELINELVSNDPLLNYIGTDCDVIDKFELLLFKFRYFSGNISTCNLLQFIYVCFNNNFVKSAREIVDDKEQPFEARYGSTQKPFAGGGVNESTMYDLYLKMKKLYVNLYHY